MLIRHLNDRYLLSFLRDEMDRVFRSVFQDSPWEGRLGLHPPPAFPAMNIWEDGENVMVEAELPGLKMEDVEVFVVGNELTVRGERKDEHREGAGDHRRERGVGSFSRVIRLPVDINADNVKASLKDGVLLVTLPKAEQAKPRRIAVQALAE